MRNVLLSLSHQSKERVAFFYDFLALALVASLVLGVFIGEFSSSVKLGFIILVFCFALTVTLLMRFFGVYRETVRILVVEPYRDIVVICACASLAIGIFFEIKVDSALLLSFSLSLSSSIVVVGGRLFAHIWLRDNSAIKNIGLPRGRNKADKNLSPVALVGKSSESTTEVLASSYFGRGMTLSAFIDSDNQVFNRYLAGKPVYSLQNLQSFKNEHPAIKTLVLSGAVSQGDYQELHNSLSCAGYDLVKWNELHKPSQPPMEFLDYDGLLGRNPIPPVHDLMKPDLVGKCVMVTGAGGSIGSELCKQVLEYAPKTLVLFDHSEFNLYQIEQRLQVIKQRRRLETTLVSILGSVTRGQRVEQTMKDYQVNTVYHAAAYKHVPLVEQNIIEGVFNNVFGTLRVAQAAIASGVDNFVLVSTDKAVRPTNVMGASKRMAELVCQSLSPQAGDGMGYQAASREQITRFSIVRFGNVLGSSGSVIPLFVKQITSGGPVTVTHPDITRYFMSIPEAAQLVIQAGAMGGNGDVFVLDMGAPVKISDLAKKLILYYGYKVKSPDNPGGIAITYSGLRPGEKLYEELLVDGNVTPCDHPRIFRASEPMLAWERLSLELEALRQAVGANDTTQVERILNRHVAGFNREKAVAAISKTNHSLSVLSVCNA